MSEKDNPDFEPEPVQPSDDERKIREFVEESELQGGVWIDRLPLNHSLEIQTKNTTYLLEKKEDGYYLSGNPKYCPTPTKFVVYGSGLGLLRAGFIGRGLKLEGMLPGYIIFSTSAIQEIREIPFTASSESDMGDKK